MIHRQFRGRIWLEGRDPTNVLYDKIAKAEKLTFTEFKEYRPDIFDYKTEDFSKITRTDPRHKCLQLCNYAMIK